MINLNSSIKPPLMINEGREAVPGKDSSYHSDTFLRTEWLTVQEPVSLH